MERTSRADVDPVRQQTQYTCMSCSVSMCFKSLGLNLSEDAVNQVLGATPMQGASWEDAIQTAQHFGIRATLTSPATLSQLQKETDKGNPVIISWSPSGNPWSHASVIYDIKDGKVHIADPNMANPTKTSLVIDEDEFYPKWLEKGAQFNFRRPALILSREITEDGKQVMASTIEESWDLLEKAASSIEQAWGPVMGESKIESSKFGGILHPQIDDLLPDATRKDLENEKQAASGLPGAKNDPETFSDEYDPGKRVDEGYRPGEVKKAGPICRRALQRLARTAFREAHRGMIADVTSSVMKWERLQPGCEVSRLLVEASKVVSIQYGKNPSMMESMAAKQASDDSGEPIKTLGDAASRIATKLIQDCKDELPELRIALEISKDQSSAGMLLHREVTAQTTQSIEGIEFFVDATVGSL